MTVYQTTAKTRFLMHFICLLLIRSKEAVGHSPYMTHTIKWPAKWAASGSRQIYYGLREHL